MKSGELYQFDARAVRCRDPAAKRQDSIFAESKGSGSGPDKPSPNNGGTMYNLSFSILW